MTTPSNKIKLLLLDVDGVLTDGSIMINDLGHETKRFNVKDGFGLAAWRKSGRQVGIITARAGRALNHRMQELGIDLIIQGASRKIDHYQKTLADLNLNHDEVAYMGDDLPDLAVMQTVGYPIAPADARPEILEIAKYTCTHKGGHGAVREAVEHLLKQAGAWDNIVADYQAT